MYISYQGSIQWGGVQGGGVQGEECRGRGAGGRGAGGKPTPPVSVACMLAVKSSGPLKFGHNTFIFHPISK